MKQAEYRWLDSYGYVHVRQQGHPRATCHGGVDYVREHILIAERALGRPLPERAVVHHVNGDRADNRTDNLVVCQDQAYHFLLHQRQRARDACGDPTWPLCSYCKRHDHPSALTRFGSGGKAARHRECHRSYERWRLANSGRTMAEWRAERRSQHRARTQR